MSGRAARSISDFFCVFLGSPQPCRRLAKLPPSSRLRQAAVWRTARLAVEAYNRRDLDAVGIGYHPEFEYHPARNWVEAGLLEPSYRGLEGYRRYVASTAEVFGA